MYLPTQEQNPEIAARLRERLSAAYDKDANGCWNWKGSTKNCPYGQLTFMAHHITPHRASYFAFVGPINPGALILHKCDNPKCINPDHLYQGDYVNNRDDMLSRRRWSHPYAARTECFRGHPYTETSYRIAKDGSRVCRVCMREHQRAFRKRKSA